MSMPAHATEPADLVARLRRVLSAVPLECRCRSTLDGALDRFSALESRQRARRGLRDARRRRDWIATRLSFLGELDELSENEADRTVFDEMALLFEEIAVEAERAAGALRSAKDPPPLA